LTNAKNCIASFGSSGEIGRPHFTILLVTLEWGIWLRVPKFVPQSANNLAFLHQSSGRTRTQHLPQRFTLALDQ
jgi:hypothetical protein